MLRKPKLITLEVLDWECTERPTAAIQIITKHRSTWRISRNQVNTTVPKEY